jgi:hypothetical protein
MTFRFWLREKWYEYLAECEAFKQEPIADLTAYFQKYKYWLKREYKYQLKNNERN